MRVRIEFLRDPNEELSVCFACEAEAFDLNEAIAFGQAHAKANEARDARAFQIRDLGDEFERVLTIVAVQPMDTEEQDEPDSPVEPDSDNPGTPPST